MEFQSFAKQALPLHKQNVVAELVPKGLPWSSANLTLGVPVIPAVCKQESRKWIIQGLEKRSINCLAR